MKKLTVFILALLTLTVLAGCAATRTETSHTHESSIQTVFSDKGRALTVPLPATANGEISPEEAKLIAFKHANIQAKEAYKIELELERDDGIRHYDISFKSGNTAFEYEIHAQTGEILSQERDIKPVRTEIDARAITQAQAKNIAFGHAGIQEADARNFEIEIDTESTKVVYEIQFHSGAYEYEYEIDALSGTIIKFERER